MTNQLTVVRSEGLNPAIRHAVNANLGVSFSKTTYFSKQVMTRYMEWAGERFHKLLVIVADHLEGYNAQVFKALPADTAFARALETGRQLRDAYSAAGPASLRGRVRGELASELLAESGCAHAVGIVRQAAETNGGFREDLTRSVMRGLGGKIEEARRRGVHIGDSELAILANYLIEEVGIILYINHLAVTLYPVLLYPHFIPPVVREVYSGAYNGCFLGVTRGQPLRSIGICDQVSFDAQPAAS